MLWFDFPEAVLRPKMPPPVPEVMPLEQLERLIETAEKAQATLKGMDEETAKAYAPSLAILTRMIEKGSAQHAAKAAKAVEIDKILNMMAESISK